MGNKQKNIFLESEGDAWYERNKAKIIIDQNDDIIYEILRLIDSRSVSDQSRLLEIGCADGSRLKWLQDNTSIVCHGVEPSAIAVKYAVNNGLRVVKGVASKLDYTNHYFDIIVYGFCLYLTDPDDYFKIIYEANRVLKPNGYIIIKDFYSDSFLKNEYKHKGGVFSHKMNYQKLFDWHPGFTCLTHTVRHHETQLYTNDLNEWVSTVVIYKSM